MLSNNFPGCLLLDSSTLFAVIDLFEYLNAATVPSCSVTFLCGRIDDIHSKELLIQKFNKQHFIHSWRAIHTTPSVYTGCYNSKKNMTHRKWHVNTYTEPICAPRIPFLVRMKHGIAPTALTRIAKI